VFWDAAVEFGPVFSFRIANHPAWVSVGEPALIEQIFAADNRFFAAGETTKSTLPPGTLLDLDEHEQLALLDESRIAARVDAVVERLRPGQQLRATELFLAIVLGRARTAGWMEHRLAQWRARARPLASVIAGSRGDPSAAQSYGPAHSLAWTLWLLSGHRLHREQVVEEARDPVGVSRMIPAVIDEAMRLRPIAHHTARRLARPLDVGEWTLPAGTLAMPSQAVAHFRADLWDSPYEFRPERFSSASSPSPFVYFPLGGSPAATTRARRRMQVILRRLLQRVDLRVAVAANPRPAACGSLLGPSDGVPIIIETIRRA
jgi:hypothetical protein